MDPFDGFPYLVTRIGHSALRHMAIVPAAWPRHRLIVARHQAAANQLETCMCIAPADAVHFNAGGTTRADPFIPTGIPVDWSVFLLTCPCGPVRMGAILPAVHRSR